MTNKISDLRHQIVKVHELLSKGKTMAAIESCGSRLRIMTQHTVTVPIDARSEGDVIERVYDDISDHTIIIMTFIGPDRMGGKGVIVKLNDESGVVALSSRKDQLEGTRYEAVLFLEKNALHVLNIGEHLELFIQVSRRGKYTICESAAELERATFGPVRDQTANDYEGTSGTYWALAVRVMRDQSHGEEFPQRFMMYMSHAARLERLARGIRNCSNLIEVEALVTQCDKLIKILETMKSKDEMYAASESPTGH